jgi:HEAT repeat protein
MTSDGLSATFEFLAKTPNAAAVDVLIAALDCSHRPTRDSALSAVMDRLEPRGHHEVFRRLPKLDKQARAIVSRRGERLLRVVDSALKDPRSQPPTVACHAILAFRMYDASEALTSILADPRHPTTMLAAKTLLLLAERFYAQLRGAEEKASKHRDMDTLRRRMITTLEEAVRKYRHHRQRDVVEALLIVVKHQNVTLRTVLQRADESGHRPIVDVLSNSQRGGVIRLLLSFLEDPKMPRIVARILSSRCDSKFVKNLLRATGPKPSRSVAESLARLDSIAWARPGHEVLAKLDDEEQHAAVQLLLASHVDRQEVLEVIGYLLSDGKPGGRRAAASALARFEGPRADALTVQALNDDDPEVQSHILKQLRPRKIPGALSLLFRMVGSTREQVCQALREAMPEFSFQQFMGTFDSMPEQLQIIGGHLVKQIDPKAKEKLTAEMETLSPVRRRRAVQAAAVMGLVRDMEETVVGLLADDDHMVRVVAAKALADCESMMSWEALRDALLDRSFIVQEAAEKSLQRISRSLQPEPEEETHQETVP